MFGSGDKDVTNEMLSDVKTPLLNYTPTVTTCDKNEKYIDNVDKMVDDVQPTKVVKDKDSENSKNSKSKSSKSSKKSDKTKSSKKSSNDNIFEKITKE